jgi:hypothetical protein
MYYLRTRWYTIITFRIIRPVKQLHQCSRVTLKQLSKMWILFHDLLNQRGKKIWVGVDQLAQLLKLRVGSKRSNIYIPSPSPSCCCCCCCARSGTRLLLLLCKLPCLDKKKTIEEEIGHPLGTNSAADRLEPLEQAELQVRRGQLLPYLPFVLAVKYGLPLHS